MTGQRWTSEEIIIIKEKYNIISYGNLKKLLPNRSWPQILERARLLGFKHRSKYWFPEEIKFIKNNYLIKTQDEIAKELQRHPASICIKIKKLNLKKSSIWNDIDKTKKCSVCNIFKSYNNFSKCKNDTLRGLAYHCKECQAKSAKKCNRTLRDEVFQAYGGYQCKCCYLMANNDKEKLFFCLDHVNNDGKKHRDEVHGKTNRIYRWLRNNNYPPIIQVLCHSCNQAKQLNGGICPHQEQKPVSNIQITNDSDIPNRPIWQYNTCQSISMQ